jgi:hypothetical protein
MICVMQAAGPRSSNSRTTASRTCSVTRGSKLIGEKILLTHFSCRTATARECSPRRQRRDAFDLSCHSIQNCQYLQAGRSLRGRPWRLVTCVRSLASDHPLTGQRGVAKQAMLRTSARGIQGIPIEQPATNAQRSNQQDETHVSRQSKKKSPILMAVMAVGIPLSTNFNAVWNVNSTSFQR